MDSPNLDTLLDELSDLAQQELPHAQFYSSILQAVLDAAGAQAAGLWSVIGEKYRLESESGLLALGLDVETQLQGMHEEALASVSGLASQIPTDPTTEPLLLVRQFQEFEFRFFPCRNHGRAFVVLEVVTGNQQRLQWDFYSRLLAAVAEIVNDYYTRQHLNWLEAQHAVTGELVPILERIYARPSLQQTAFEIANEGRRFIQCDRVSVCLARPGKCEIVCISGVDRIQGGSRQVRALRALAESVVLTGRPLVYTHEYQAESQRLPQQEELLQSYLDVAEVKQLYLVPLVAPMVDGDRLSSSTESDPVRRSKSTHSNNSLPCIGALAFEGVQLDAPLLKERITVLSQHAERALAHASDLESIPLIKFGRGLQRLDQRALVRRLLVAALCLAGCGLLFVIPTELTVQAKGRYQPSEIQHVFAPLNGEVIQFPSAPRAVKQGEPLILMRSRQWELKREEILTQRGVTLEKLRGVESARLNNRRPNSNESNSSIDLSASERELRELLSSQDQQLAVVDDMLKDLNITSPVNGTLLSWNPLESWQLRPVQQGQKLLTIAKDGGSGQLQLQVKDSDIRHVWAAYTRSSNSVSSDSRASTVMRDLPVTFAIASEPGSRFTARLVDIGTITENVAGEGPCVRVTALVQDAPDIQAKHGATVVARIGCGRTSLAYAWTRRLWDYLNMHWLP